LGAVIPDGITLSVDPSGRISAVATSENAEYANGASGAGLTIGFTNGRNQSVLLSADTTLTLSALVPGVLRLRIIQGVTPYTCRWAVATGLSTGSLKWMNGVSGIVSGGGNTEDILVVYFNGTDFYANLSKNFR
jgi:hypothetical protein